MHQIMVSLHQQKMVTLHQLTLMKYLLLVVALISVFITVAISAIQSVHTQEAAATTNMV